MNISLLLNYDLASLLALNYLSPIIEQHQLTVFYSKKENRAVSKELQTLAAFERKQIESTVTLKPFSDFRALQLNQVNTLDIEPLLNSNPDLLISVRHMTILKDSVINLPRLGVINLHSGLLPHYQGVMATFWSMFNRETQIGTSLHFINDEKIDTGPIISQSLVKVDYQRSYLWNTLNVYRSGCEQITDAVEKLATGDGISSIPQSGPASYYSFPRSVDIDAAKFNLFSDNDSVSDFYP